MDYDRAFRLQAAINPSLEWNTLYPGLQASTILGRQTGPTTFCSLCQECDHKASECALVVFENHPSTHSWPITRPLTNRLDPTSHVCFSWNEGECSRPGRCAYRHVCSICQRAHKARECRSNQRGSNPQSHSQPNRTHRQRR